MQPEMFRLEMYAFEVAARNRRPRKIESWRLRLGNRPVHELGTFFQIWAHDSAAAFGKHCICIAPDSIALITMNESAYEYIRSKTHLPK